MARAVEREESSEPAEAPRSPAGRRAAPSDARNAVPPSTGGTFRSLRHRDYRLMFIGTLFASSGLWLQQVTINYLAFALSGSSLVVGLASGARSIPLFAAPLGGVMADRYDKKRLMLSTQVAQMVLTFLFAVVIMAGWLQVWHIFVFSLLSGVAWALNMPVRQSVMPSTVPREDLMNAMALNSAGFNITRIAGPALAGLMIAKVGAGENFLIQAGAYLIVAWLVMRLSLPTTRSDAKSAGSALQNLREGAAFVWGSRTLRVQMLLALVPVLIALPYIAILPQFNVEALNGTASTFGLLMAAPGIGAVVATLVVASMKNNMRYGMLLLGSLFALGLSLIALAFAVQLWVVLVMLVLVGGTQMVYMTASQTVVQLAIPDEYRGRVMGIYMLNQGMLPLGSMFAGTLADLYSASLALMVMGALVSLLAIVFYFGAGSLRRLEV
jgi:MFS family permease